MDFAMHLGKLALKLPTADHQIGIKREAKKKRRMNVRCMKDHS
jgi:hypothetical protein